jgi:hypothetical protein
VARELDRLANQACQDWVAQNKEVFTTPTAAEAGFVGDIYAVRHFQQNMDIKKLQKGGFNADPVVAKATVSGGSVVTLEQHSPNAARTPNICEHFGIECISLEEFMEAEGWTF